MDNLLQKENIRMNLEDLITTNACLIDILKDACELNIELEYLCLVHSSLGIISKNQQKALQLVTKL